MFSIPAFTPMKTGLGAEKGVFFFSVLFFLFFFGSNLYPPPPPPFFTYLGLGDLAIAFSHGCQKVFLDKQLSLDLFQGGGGLDRQYGVIEWLTSRKLRCSTFGDAGGIRGEDSPCFTTDAAPPPDPANSTQ